MRVGATPSGRGCGTRGPSSGGLACGTRCRALEASTLVTLPLAHRPAPASRQVLRDSWCLEVMHRAFTNGLMRYGMMTATKKAAA